MLSNILVFVFVLWYKLRGTNSEIISITLDEIEREVFVGDYDDGLIERKVVSESIPEPYPPPQVVNMTKAFSLNVHLIIYYSLHNHFIIFIFSPYSYKLVSSDKSHGVDVLAKNF